MAPLPKRRLSRGRGRRRFDGKSNPAEVLKNNFTICSNCKSQTLAHNACAICGYYKGSKVI